MTVHYLLGIVLNLICTFLYSLDFPLCTCNNLPYVPMFNTVEENQFLLT